VGELGILVLQGLVEANLAAAAAVFLVLAVRRHVHALLGPGAAYLLWGIVPAAMLATLFPARIVAVPAPSIPQDMWNALTPLAWLFLAIWIGGAATMATLLVRRQKLFIEDVEMGKAGPAVVGFFYPSIVTPSDFTQRFTLQEQKLILTHEAVHIERWDARINTFAAIGQALFWFNPLIHLGASRMRADQEVSCDAAVIDRRPRARRIYAETLVKTQLAHRPLPVGCYWPVEPNGDAHPLAERISMLTRTPFSHPRRLAAGGLILALVIGGGYAAWAAQPARESFSTRIRKDEVYVTFQPLADQQPIKVLIIPQPRGGT
jgi:beta-lactamase regulating signal transducer with metallopeptidase domain